MNRLDPWLRILNPNPAARLRLFCFPYAGGAASMYRQWHQHLPTTVEVCAVQPPGRETRIREAPYRDAAELVRALMPNLLPHLDRPFALFGHSMGALIAYELAHQLQAHDRTPTRLLVSGRRAPILPDPESPLHAVPTDEAFLSAMQRRYNNIPAMIMQDAELRALFVPLLRADLALVECYQPAQTTPLPHPIVALGGEVDALASQAELRAWQTLTHSEFAMHTFPGGHFYITADPQPVLATIAGYLRQDVRR